MCLHYAYAFHTTTCYYKPCSHSRNSFFIDVLDCLERVLQYEPELQSQQLMALSRLESTALIF